jgi:hypothetical protein
MDASREQASGSAGLGLAIAREIAAAHGATIELTEAPGGGAERASRSTAARTRCACGLLRIDDPGVAARVGQGVA